MCNCKTWAKTPEMTSQGGKYQMAWHHPNCEDFKTEEFARIEYDGTCCVMEVGEADAFMRDADCPEHYQRSVVNITRDQFNALADFDGF
jgi:hypothetical protein